MRALFPRTSSWLFRQGLRPRTPGSWLFRQGLRPRTPGSWLFLLLLALACGCGAAQKAAANDPMRCERDPKCAAKHGRDRDCTTQCNDDPACMDRCREMSQDHLGAPP